MTTVLEQIVLTHRSLFRSYDCWERLSCNPCISFTFILNHLDWPWSIECLVTHPHLNLYHLEQLSNHYVFPTHIWDIISRHKQLSIDWIHRYPNKPWSYYWLTRRNDFQIKWLECLWASNPLHTTNDKLKWRGVIAENLSTHPNLDLSWLQKFPDLPWKWDVISKSPNLRVEWIQAFPTANWDWSLVGESQHLTLSWLQALPSAPWNWDQLSGNFSYQNKNGQSLDSELTIKWIQALPDAPWNWSIISYHPNLSRQWLETFPDKPWNWTRVLMNRNLHLSWLQFIPHDVSLQETKFWRAIRESGDLELLKHLHQLSPLRWEQLCYNPHLTYEWFQYFAQEGQTMPTRVMCQLSQHYNLQPEWILNHPEWEWSPKHLSNHPGFNCLQFASRFFRQLPKKYWCPKTLTRHHNWVPDWWTYFPQEFWDYSDLASCHPITRYLTLDWVRQHLNLPCSWINLANNRHFTIDWVDQLPQADWDFQILSQHPKLSLEWLQKFPLANWDLPYIQSLQCFHPRWLLIVDIQGWNWKALSHDSRLTLKMGLQLRHHPWDLEQLHKHPLLSLEWFRAIPEVTWDLTKLSSHPNLHLEWINTLGAKEDWHPYRISVNRCNYLPTLEYYLKRKQQTLLQTCRFRDELIERAWEPHRFTQWCLCLEERYQIAERWTK